MLKQWIFKSLMLVSPLSLAGTIGDATHLFSGFSAGVGGSYTYSNLNGQTNIIQINSAPSSAEYLLSHNILNHLAPVFNTSYYYPLGLDWDLGIKFLYKYIGQEQFDQTWSGTYQDGSYQSAGLRTKSVQNFNLLFNAGYQFDQWFLYAGGGPGWADVEVELNGSLLPAGSLVFTPVNVTKKKTILGGAGQFGFGYMFPKRFMVDLSYNFLATPTTNVPALIFPATAGRYSSFNQRVSVVEQGFNVTLNKYLNF